MTGRELILYIMMNHLEDKEIFTDDTFLDLINVEQAAIKFKVGPEVIKAWYSLGILPGIKIGESLFFKKDVVLKERDAKK